MSRYIDAEPLEKNCTQLFADIVKAQPTADVEPVRHGQWIYIGFEQTYKCSCCEKLYGMKHNYCPNCGAKMDGEK